MWTDAGAEEQRSGGTEAHDASSPLPLNSSAPPHTLVLGLGNPILGDDGVGWRVIEKAQKLIRSNDFGRESDETTQVVTTNLEFDCVALGGLALMERLVGYDRAILVDAIQTAEGAPGTIHRLTLDDLPTLHADSAHDATLTAALALGQRLGAALPQDIVIFGIEAVNVLDFSESLSSQVAASVGRAAEAVLAELADGREQIADSK
jgi:hydrogenase maturation protease